MSNDGIKGNFSNFLQKFQYPRPKFRRDVASKRSDTKCVILDNFQDKFFPFLIVF